MTIHIAPEYSAISAVRDICEPWIEVWGGDEWGESMFSLHAAAHTSYGFDDEDCALFATRLYENLMSQKVWMDEDGEDYGLNEPEVRKQAQTVAAERREYWLKGGNIPSEHSVAQATSVIEQMPAWLFEEVAE